MRRLRLISLAVAVAAACFAASPAAGYKTGGKGWPGTSVRYYNASPQNAAAVQDAVRAWNASGVRVRFVPTTRKRAQIIIRTGPRGCSGFAQIGSQGRFGMLIGSGCERRFMALIAAHELGHVLGLSHEMGRCATMNPTILNWVGDRCKQVRGDPWQYRCRLLERDDVRGAIRLYGGSVNPKAVGVAWCDRFAPLTPPGEVQATATLTTINCGGAISPAATCRTPTQPSGRATVRRCRSRLRTTFRRSSQATSPPARSERRRSTLPAPGPTVSRCGRWTASDVQARSRCA